MNFPSVWRWVSESEYAAAAAASGPLAVVRPSQQARQRQWEHVLEWYGMEPYSPGHEASAGVQPPPAPGWVVALDATGAAAGRVLAARTGRPLARIDADSGAARRVSALAGDGPVVLLARPAVLRAGLLVQLNAVPALTWSVLTGRDLAALSFLIAKTLADHWTRAARADERHDLLVLDAIGRQARRVQPDRGRRALVPLTAAHVRSLFEDSWDAVVLRAHGEGAHAHLGGTILCGLTGDRELLTDGRPADGCRVEGERIVCKRGPVAVAVASFGDVRTRRFAFYSCNGFSTAAELYPSNVSAALAMAEGYPCSVLANDRLASVGQDVLDLAALKIAADAGQVGLWQAENARAETTGGRQWVLLGDDPVEARDAASLPGVPNLDLPPDRAPEGSIWGIAGVDDDGADTVEGAVADHRHMHLLGRTDVAPDARVRDVRRQWERMCAVTEALAERCRANSDAEARVSRVLGSDLIGGEAARQALEDVVEAQRQVTVLAVQALDALGHARSCRILDRRTRLTYELFVTVCREWDRRFVVLARCCLRDGSLEQLFTAGRLHQAEKDGALCRRCGYAVRVTRWRYGAGAECANMTARCTVCGPQAGWTEGGPRLCVDFPGVVGKGTMQTLAVEVGPAPIADEVAGGTLLLSFKDKARGTGVLDLERRVRQGGRVAVPVTVPADVASDLHTLRALWVGGLALAYARVRCAAVPASSQREERS